MLTPNQRPGVVAEGAILPGPELCQGPQQQFRSMGKAVPAPRCTPRHPFMQYTGVQDTQSGLQSRGVSAGRKAEEYIEPHSAFMKQLLLWISTGRGFDSTPNSPAQMKTEI